MIIIFLNFSLTPGCTWVSAFTAHWIIWLRAQNMLKKMMH